MESLFPSLPEDISAASPDELKTLIADHESARDLIAAEDEEFLKDLGAEEILAELEKGGNQYKLLLEEQKLRDRAHENYVAKKDEGLKAFEPAEEDDGEGDGGDGEEAAAPVEVLAEEGDGEGDGDGDGEGGDEGGDGEGGSEGEKIEERELVLASAPPPVRFSRTPPAPKADRLPVVEESSASAALVATGEFSSQFKDALDPYAFGDLVKTAAMHYGPASKTDPVGKYSSNSPFNGPTHKIAHATFDYPDDRTLGDNSKENLEKIDAVVAATMPGMPGSYSLTASGGLCAPAEPFYSLVNFATTAEPVWDSLPIFAARRGAVNVPESNYIADITTAISSISEANDALGGTFATKSCQALECYEYTETAVNIIAHCREYGNLNARSWPELIAHENELTMAAMARTSEEFILERIKALSINVTSGANTLSALIYLVDAIAKSAFGIRGRFRMPADARFRVLLPAVIFDMLLVDGVQNSFNQGRTRADYVSYLRSIGVDPVVYLDGNFAAGDDMIPDAAQSAGALESWPNTFQWALFPEGAFLGIDMGVLELGIVRDSELNSTNDFQVFGERFRNVVRIAPAQACYWETTTLCAVGNFPPAGTARTCES